MIRTIQFAGPLADRFGDEPVRFWCDGWQTLFSGLETVYPGFRQELGKYEDVCILKKTGDQFSSVTADELKFTFGQADTLYICAAESGSGPETFASFVAWISTTFEVTTVTATAIATVAVNVAITVALQVVMYALTDRPSVSGDEERAKRESTLFNGAENTVEQGGARPLIYGRHRVGGTIISSEISTEQIPQLTDDTITFFGGDSYTGNVLTNDIAREFLSVTVWACLDVAKSPGQTYTQAESSVGAADGFSVTVQSNGAITVTSGVNCVGFVPATYTVTDSQTGDVFFAAINIQIRSSVPWVPPDTW